MKDIPIIIRERKTSFQSAIKSLPAEIVKSFHPAWELALRDINSTYRQSLLGPIWILLPPLITTVLWISLNVSGIAQISGTTIPYPVFVTAGTLLWTTFIDALNSPKNQISANISSLSSLSFPPEALIISGIIQNSFNFLVRFSILLGVMLWCGTPISISIFVYLFGAGCIYILGLSSGLLVAPVAALYKDIGNAINISIPLFMYVTPVVYPLPKQGILKYLMEFNPLTYLFDFARYGLDIGTINSNKMFIALAITTIGLLGVLFFWIANKITIHILSERS
jgi:lipopolysaccharide transport system permease protein